MIQTDFFVSSSETGADLCIRTSRLLGIFQDAAAEDCAINLHLGREELLRLCGGLWIVSRTSLYLDLPVTVGKYSLTTWHAGVHGVLWNRGYALQNASDRTVARCITQWTILSEGLPRRILRLPDAPAPAPTPFGFSLPPLLRFRTDSLTLSGERRIGRSILDENRHCNNALAADIIEDALSDTVPLSGTLPRLRELHLHYCGEAHCGDTLDLLTGSDDLFQYAVTSRDGERIHEAALRRE